MEIRYGVDLSREPKPPRTTERPLTLGFIGQLAPHKGPDLMIDAAAQGLGKSGYELRIYGALDQDPRFVEALRARAAELPIRFVGTFPKESMREILDGLDVLVIPSRWYENSPLVLLNALASHTPVVVSDVDGMTEFVTEGINGFVFPLGSVEGLAKVFRRIAAERGRLAALSRTTNYEMTTRAMTDKTLEVYQDALAVHPRADGAGGVHNSCLHRTQRQIPKAFEPHQSGIPRLISSLGVSCPRRLGRVSTESRHSATPPWPRTSRRSRPLS